MAAEEWVNNTVNNIVPNNGEIGGMENFIFFLFL